MHNSDSLIHTKLCLPFIRPSLVTRPRLQEQVLQGLRGPLTLIIAPAGFGKTTLAAACVTGHGMPVAWLSLDKNDNQVERFLEYLIAALHKVDETIGNDAAQLMAEMHQVSPEAVLTSLINGLDITGRELILVLDDYQFINSQAVHQAVGFLLEHCPHTLHMVIATRVDPPLPFARLRARGQMVEFRAADLRFTAAEAAQFLNDIMGLSLDAGSVAVLEERTEGWVAGLQMAALSIRGRDTEHVGDFIQAFAGTNRFIMDFMLAEVLAREPEAVQAFLVQTAILARLSGSLCDAILGISDGQEILERLERQNLFVIPLDDKGCWYRYHHLFADLLRVQLDQLYPGVAPRLHSLAATWYESNGFYEDAIQHTLAAGDYPGAARLVETVAENAWLYGQYASILAWTKAIPEEVVQRRPWLCIWNAWAHTQMGVSQAIDQWITIAEQAIKKQREDVSSITSLDASHEALNNEIVALRAFAVSFLKDYDQAIELAEAVLKRPPLENKKVAQFTRCNTMHLLSSIYYATGNLLKAEQACQETIELAKEMGFTLRHLHAVNKLVLVNRANGQLYRSYQLIEDTLLFLATQGFNNYFAISQLFLRKMEILYEWNQLDEFQLLVESILRQELLVDVPYLQVDIYNLQALAFLHKRDYPKAQDVLNRAKALARQSYIWEGLTWRMESLQMKLWLQKGDLSQAIAWNSQRTVGLDHLNRFSIESYELSRARILLAQGAGQEALSLLNRLANSAEVEGRKGSLIEIRSLKAIALLGLQELEQAAAEVESSLALAEPEGFVRTFLDEGHPMRILLSHVANNASSLRAEYAFRLLTAFQEGQGSALTRIQLPIASFKAEAALGHDISDPALIEPLSRRELEVLHFMSLGRSNQEIAQQLVVAPGTVKAHTASIYRKLNVTNRTEAAARARHLGILP